MLKQKSDKALSHAHGRKPHDNKMHKTDQPGVLLDSVNFSCFTSSSQELFHCNALTRPNQPCMARHKLDLHRIEHIQGKETKKGIDSTFHRPWHSLEQ